MASTDATVVGPSVQPVRWEEVEGARDLMAFSILQTSSFETSTSFSPFENNAPF